MNHRRPSRLSCVVLLLLIASTIMLRLTCIDCFHLVGVSPRVINSRLSTTRSYHRHFPRRCCPESLLSVSATQQESNNETTTTTTLDWRAHSDLNSVVEFPTWITPSQHVQTVLQSPILTECLPKFESERRYRKKIRLVQRYNATHQLILVNNDININKNNDDSSLKQHNKSGDVEALLQSLNVIDGPSFSVSLDPSFFTMQHILSTVLALPPRQNDTTPLLQLLPSSYYEQVGHIAQLNLKPHLLPHRYTIAEVLLESIPNIKTVLQKQQSSVPGGPHRVIDCEILAGQKDTHVTVVEDSLSFCFDLSQVNWNSRWAGERQYMLNHVFQRGDTIVDVFCGVGALCVLAAKKLGCNVYANDWNKHAIDSLQGACRKYGLKMDISCQDAYESLVDIGLTWGESLPHHVVMNYPLEAPFFLNALRWWKVVPRRRRNVMMKKNEAEVGVTIIIPTIHVYTFVARGNDHPPQESAVDLIAHNLLPEAAEPTPNRRQHLDRLGCEVQTRTIHNVAPDEKVVICVSFKATPKLLRHMQGDFV